MIQRLARRGRADARQEMQAAETRHPVAGILRPAQEADHVLDMGGLDEFQPAEFDEGDVAPRQLQLQRAAVMGSPEQHGLLLEGGAGLARRQHPAGHIARLGPVVMNVTSRGRCSEGRSLKRFLVKRSRACSITALLAARIGWVER